MTSLPPPGSTFRKLIAISILAAVMLSACGVAIPPEQDGDEPSSRPKAATPSQIAEILSTPSPVPLSNPTFNQNGRPYRLQPGDLVLAAPEDAIPAILYDPALYVSAQEGDREWQEEEPVIGVYLEGQARAYPIRLLSNHEIVNDRVGGQPIAVTWCPLCYSAIVFSRVVNGRELTFGVSGYLFNSNLVMYDHQTNTLWSQILGQSLRGAFRNQFLSLLPSRLVSWADWKALHPDTTVLSAKSLGKQAGQVIDPYVGYYNSGAIGLVETNLDSRLPGKELVVGLNMDGESIAYPIAQVRQAGLLQHNLGTEPIMLVYVEKLASVVAYTRRTEHGVLTFHQQGLDSNMVEDVQTQSRWDLARGLALSGPLAGHQLEELHAPVVFWFAWSAMRPSTTIYPPQG